MSPPEISPAAQLALDYYDQRYGRGVQVLLNAGDKVKLGDKNDRVCRYCQKRKPGVSFKMEAHALPEALGNKAIVDFNECDVCNGFFGRTFENDFGKWSIVARTLYQIRGKSGIPTLKREAQGWRVEVDQSGIVFHQRIGDEIVIFDEAAKTMTLKVPRDPYIPIAVYKAYVKMALALVPASATGNFTWTSDWLREGAHTRPFSSDVARLYRTFMPGPRPFPGLAAFLLLRKPDVTDAPYCTFIVSFGNEVHQIFVPCPEQDRVLIGKTSLKIVPFPTPYHIHKSAFGEPKLAIDDLSGLSTVSGDVFEIKMRADAKPAQDHHV